MKMLSVIIPCYNAGEYIQSLVECIVRQSYKDWELIIVDDGSDSKTLEILDYCSTIDTRIRIIRRDREPKGGNTCRNIGFNNASGKYVVFFDADDLISDTCFEERVSFMEAHPDCDYASFPSCVFYDGDSIPNRVPSDDCITIINRKSIGKNILESVISQRYSFTVWANIYKRSAIDGINWDERILVYQDYDFMVSCALKELSHCYANSLYCDYYYRRFNNENNVSGSFVSDDKINSTIYLINKTYDRISKRRYRQKLCKFLSHFVILQYYRIEKSTSQRGMYFIDGISKSFPYYKRLFFYTKWINNKFLRLLFISVALCVRNFDIYYLKLFYVSTYKNKL